MGRQACETKMEAIVVFLFQSIAGACEKPSCPPIGDQFVFFFVSRSVFFSCWFRPSISLFCGFLPVLSQSTELFQSEPNPHDDRWLIFSSLETIKQPNFYVFFLLAFSPWLVQSLHPSPLPSSLIIFNYFHLYQIQFSGMDLTYSGFFRCHLFPTR